MPERGHPRHSASLAARRAAMSLICGLNPGQGLGPLLRDHSEDDVNISVGSPRRAGAGPEPLQSSYCMSYNAYGVASPDA